ncbi:MAG: response regulator transcription factor [Clostridiales bacterium]|jgi:DNA-binding response OmpR family regulator|nr:response regulator transcription factor [Clostridiales bacterium]
MTYRILVAEDDESIARIVKLTLEIEKHDVILASDGKMALDEIGKASFDLAVLDIMLPYHDGYELLEVLRKKNIPVIFLTAKGEVADKVKGLRLGAEDYITKPFETIELLARVDTALRRVKKQPKTIKVRDVTVDIDNRSVTKSGEAIDLTPLEYELLDKLMSNPGLLFSRDRLLDVVWGYEYAGGTRTVDTHIQKLRSKLDFGDVIKTVHKVGYKFEVGNE